jgi:hypothetical protein
MLACLRFNYTAVYTSPIAIPLPDCRRPDSPEVGSGDHMPTVEAPFRSLPYQLGYLQPKCGELADLLTLRTTTRGPTQ